MKQSKNDEVLIMSAFTGSNKIEIERGERVTRIIGQIKPPKANYYMMAGSIIFVVIFPTVFIFSQEQSLTSLGLIIFIYILSAIGGLGGLLIAKRMNSSAMGTLEIIIDKAHKTIELPKEHLTFAFSDIKDVKVGEKTGLLQKVNAIKFILKDGEKTLGVPIVNYNDGSKIVSTIKSSIGV